MENLLKARNTFLTSEGHISQMQKERKKRNQVNDQARWFQSWHLRLPALNIRIPELLFLSKCHIYSHQPWQEYFSWVSGRDTQDLVKGAKEPGGWNVGVGGSEAQGHMLLSLVVREVPGQGPSPDKLVSCGGSVYTSSTSSWGGGVTSTPRPTVSLAWGVSQEAELLS